MYELSIEGHLRFLKFVHSGKMVTAVRSTITRRNFTCATKERVVAYEQSNHCPRDL